MATVILAISYMRAKGFYYCKFLTNCEATVANTQYNGHLAAFDHCDYLNSCKGTASGAGTGYGARLAFDDCEYMANCQGESSGNANGTDSGVPFRHCNNIAQCRSIANCTGAPGFYQCYYMTYCTSTKNFDLCFAGAKDNSTYAAADTLNGGWNRILA